MTLKRSKDGLIFGVCKGIAQSLGVGVTFVRILTLMAFIMTGFFPTAVIYILLALILETN